MTVKGEQNFENTVTYTNVQTTGKKEEITGHATVGTEQPGMPGIKYTTGAGCPNGGQTFEDGIYEGTFTARAETTDGLTPTDLTLVDTP